MANKKQNLSSAELLEQALVPENECPYEVPVNWVWTRLGYVSRVVGGGTPSSGVVEYYENGTIPWITPADLSDYTKISIERGKKNITKLGFLKSSVQMIPKDAVLLSSRAPIGYVAIAANKLTTNQGFKSMLPSSAYCPQFMYFYLKFSKELLESHSSGTTFSELSGSKVEKVEFPLPPLAEQNRIIDRINSLFEKLDQAIELIQDALDSFENRKAAVLQKAFSGELTKKWREENRVGMESWELVTLGSCVKFSKEKNDPSYFEKTLPYIGLEHIEKNGGIFAIGSSDEVRSLKSVFRKGDILYGKLRPYLNKHDIAKCSGICSTDILVMRNSDVCKVKYLNYLFDTSMFIMYACENSKGINLPRVSETILSEFEFKLPSDKEVQEIVRVLDDIFVKEGEANELASQIITVENMKKSILARAFRGELGTNDPQEENAIELLKEIIQSER